MGVQRPVPILVVAALAALLAGCAADPVAEPTPSPSFTSEAEAFAAAEATYRAYVDALNQVDLADPETFEAVYAWTTGDLNARDRKNLTQMRAAGQSVAGDSLVASVDLISADLQGRKVELAVCVDVSEVSVADSNGVSVVAPDRVSVQSIAIQLTGSESDGMGLAISTIVGREGEPTC